MRLITIREVVDFEVLLALEEWNCGEAKEKTVDCQRHSNNKTDS